MAGTMSMTEVVVTAESRISQRTAMDLRLLYRHDTMLLGVSRKGKPFRDRVRQLTILPGDVLLLMGEEEQLTTVVKWLGVLPLAPRGLQVTQYQKAWLSIGLFAGATVGLDCEHTQA